MLTSTGLIPLLLPFALRRERVKRKTMTGSKLSNYDFVLRSDRKGWGGGGVLVATIQDKAAFFPLTLPIPLPRAYLALAGLSAANRTSATPDKK